MQCVTWVICISRDANRMNAFNAKSFDVRSRFSNIFEHIWMESQTSPHVLCVDSLNNNCLSLWLTNVSGTNKAKEKSESWVKSESLPSNKKNQMNSVCQRNFWPRAMCGLRRNDWLLFWKAHNWKRLRYVIVALENNNCTERGTHWVFLSFFFFFISRPGRECIRATELRWSHKYYAKKQESSRLRSSRYNTPIVAYVIRFTAESSRFTSSLYSHRSKCFDWNQSTMPNSTDLQTICGINGWVFIFHSDPEWCELRLKYIFLYLFVFFSFSATPS